MFCLKKCIWKCHQPQATMFVNTLRPRQNGYHFPDNIFKRTVLNENCCILMKCYWNLFPKVQSTTFQHWFRWWLSLMTHILCITRPQWVKGMIYLLSWKGNNVTSTFFLTPAYFSHLQSLFKFRFKMICFLWFYEFLYVHDDIFTGPLCKGACDAELWCFLCC